MYFVRRGSATILSEAEVYSVQKVLCNFKSGQDAEVAASEKITFQVIYRNNLGKDFSFL